MGNNWASKGDYIIMIYFTAVAAYYRASIIVSVGIATGLLGIATGRIEQYS